MSSEIAIRARDISKHYVMFARPEDRLKQMVVPRLQRALGKPPARYYRDFAALNGVSFDIRRGETVGIVGRNGSGKSTLLQIVCGTLQPTGGSIEVNGRVAALLELGAGFNPEFTGRENVYLNAAILGLSRAEIDARFNDIARFADIGDFIEQPVKTYSSGMYVRLAFATAINVDPDILVVDEALAVGDEAFQRKCFARIEQIKERGGTILFVSHGAQTIVQLCDRAMLIDTGEKILEGKPKRVVGQYQRLVNASAQSVADIRKSIIDSSRSVNQTADRIDEVSADDSDIQTGNTHGDHFVQQPDATITDDTTQMPESFDEDFVSKSGLVIGTDQVAFSDISILTLHGKRVNTLRNGRRYRVTFVARFLKDAASVGFGFSIRTTKGVMIFGYVTDRMPENRIKLIKSGSAPKVEFEFTNSLIDGACFVNIAVFSVNEGARRVLAKIEDAMIFKTALPDIDSQCSGLVDANCSFFYRP